MNCATKDYWSGGAMVCTAVFPTQGTRSFVLNETSGFHRLRMSQIQLSMDESIPHACKIRYFVTFRISKIFKTDKK